MGKKRCQWQDMEYVLSYFGKKIDQARRHYLCYVEDGIDQGRRPELIGGGLIRSLGGWTEVKKRQLRGKDRLNGIMTYPNQY